MNGCVHVHGACIHAHMCDANTVCLLCSCFTCVIDIHGLVDRQTDVYAGGQMKGVVNKAIPTTWLVDSNKTALLE